ncbi:MAG: deoxynucleoside kinase, partial [Bacteroidales bacterium]|nr:deoxynucleoside kinase [Bacteroidales bacterium]
MIHNFIAIEGTIGAGKTSLATKIAEDYNGKLILEQFDDNPFLPKFYEEADKYAFPLELSFLAERYQQLTSQLTSQDLFKNFTISDYFINKSLIFAQKTLANDLFGLYSKLFQIINASMPTPDLLVYLYLKVDRLQENIRKRGRSYEQSIANEYLESIQQGYFEFIKQQQNMRILILDTNGIDFVK